MVRTIGRVAAIFILWGYYCSSAAGECPVDGGVIAGEWREDWQRVRDHQWWEGHCGQRWMEDPDSGTEKNAMEKWIRWSGWGLHDQPQWHFSQIWQGFTMKANEREIHEDLIKSCKLLTWPAHARRQLVARGSGTEFLHHQRWDLWPCGILNGDVSAITNRMYSICSMFHMFPVSSWNPTTFVDHPFTSFCHVRTMLGPLWHITAICSLYTPPKKNTHSICKKVYPSPLPPFPPLPPGGGYLFRSLLCIRGDSKDCHLALQILACVDELHRCLGQQLWLPDFWMVSFDESDLNKNVLNYAKLLLTLVLLINKLGICMNPRLTVMRQTQCCKPFPKNKGA